MRAPHGCSHALRVVNAGRGPYVRGAQTSTVMLSLLISLFRRERRFAWRPDVDLSDPYVAAALAPMTHS